MFSASLSILTFIDAKGDWAVKIRCISWCPYTWMRDLPDSREWYLSDNLVISLTCFHLGVTDYGFMFDPRSVLTLSQQFMTRGILPIMYYKWWIQLSRSRCPLSWILYEFWYAGFTGTVPPPSMNWFPHFYSSLHAAEMIPRFLYMIHCFLPRWYWIWSRRIKYPVIFWWLCEWSAIDAYV